MADFVPLHVHSHYSLLDGLAKIDELVNLAKQYEYKAMAVTDHGVMYGAVEFFQKAKAAGIKPIIGCEVYVAPRTMADKTPKIDTSPFHLILLAKNDTGYRNLIKIVSLAHLKGYYYKPRIDLEHLKKYSEGLIAMTACIQGEVPQLILSNKISKAEEKIKEYQNIFGKDDFYLELQYHPAIPEQETVNKNLKILAKKTGAKLVATHDTHYPKPEDAEAHEVLLAIQTGKDLNDKTRLSMDGSDFSFPPESFFKENFADTPEIITNTAEIAEKCNFEFEFGKLILPHYDLPKDKNSFEYLKELCLEGLKKKYSPDDEAAKKRLKYELSVIKTTHFEDYFLITQDFVNWSKKQGILVGPGRGSAAGSIVAYCLNITELDPLQYNLFFERFLNPERIAPPDIDMDFPDDRRGETIEYVREKYGADHVGQIITFGVMKARMAIRDCGRALGMPYQEVDKIAKLIPTGFTLSQTLDEVEDFKNLYNNDPAIKRLIDLTKRLEGVARHASTHAAGIVISQKPLTEYAPLQLASKDTQETVIQFSMSHVEAIGLLKMDFLGLSNLTVIKNALRIIKKIHNVDIDINNLPLEDKKTYELVSAGRTTGVFQLESEGMKRYLKELKPSKIDDIIAMVALYRPGPMDFIPDYVAGKHGRKEITYLHPDLKPILGDTYGIAVYQEQVMKIAQDIAGFSLGEADVLRKAMGKKIHKLLMEQKKKFVEGAVKKGLEKSLADKIFSFIEPFARYGFNRAHAASYGLIAYQTAYLKAHYPSEFMAALLTSDIHNLDRVAIEIAECEKMGIKVFAPNINKSFVEFGVNKEDSNITFGLGAVKNVGIGVAQRIVEERQLNGNYKSLEDFISRLGTDTINKKSVENLAKAGAIDDLAERNEVLFNIDKILKFSTNLAKQKSNGQVSLFDSMPATIAIPKLELVKTEAADQKQRLAWEKELLGIYLTDHPLRGKEHILEKYAEKISNISADNAGQNVRVGGIITSIKKILTKNSEPMLFVGLEDTTSNTEIIVFPKTLKKDFLVWQNDNIVIIDGKINNKDGILKIIAEKATIVGEQLSLENEISLPNIPQQKKEKKSSSPTKQKMKIKLHGTINKEKLSKVKNILADFPGNEEVYLEVIQHDKINLIKTKTLVKISEKLTDSLTEILGPDTIEIS